MRIKMKTSLAGARVSYQPGQEYDVDEALGEAFCADGRAEPVEPKTKPKAKPRAERTSDEPAGGAETREG